MPVRISADSLFRIGKTHQVCQDYAASFVDGEDGYAYLSDGCSTALSDPMSGCGKPQVYTDFGSRLLVLSALDAHSPGLNRQPDLDKIISHAKSRAIGMGLGIDAVSATFLSVYTLGEHLVAMVSGDGWVAGRKYSGEWEVTQVKYPSGAPYYPRYSLVQSDLEGYLGRFGSNYLINMWSGWRPGKDLVDPVVWPRELGEDHSSFHRNEFLFPFDEFDLVLAFSDGLETFGKVEDSGSSKLVESISVAQVLSETVGCLVGMGGEFLKRNLNGPTGAFRRFAKLGWEHHDDLSVVGVFRKESE